MEISCSSTNLSSSINIKTRHDHRVDLHSYKNNSSPPFPPSKKQQLSSDGTNPSSLSSTTTTSHNKSSAVDRRSTVLCTVPGRSSYCQKSHDHNRWKLRSSRHQRKHSLQSQRHSHDHPRPPCPSRLLRQTPPHSPPKGPYIIFLVNIGTLRGGFCYFCKFNKFCVWL